MKKLKPIPTFKTEAQERKFWETHDTAGYLDWSTAERAVFPNLKPSTTAVSIRLPVQKEQATIGIVEAKINEAMKWAKDQQTLVKDDYYDGYPVLRNLFDKLDLTNTSNVIAAAYAVYGWMPTILKKEPKAADLVEFAQVWKNKKRARKENALSYLRKRPCTTRAVNGSTVGTSKFLHFVAPEIFPIWDSNIASVFGITSKINNPATYIDYCDAVHRWLDDTAKPITWPAEFQGPKKISDVRKIEFCLYAYGKNCRSPK
jgi:hypothetical protein